jgi:transcriptional regulator with XRE-family HTH domain
MSDIHTRIKELRELKGISMQSLANAVGYKSWQTVQQWENGETAPKRSRLELVAKALDTTPTYLLMGSISPPAAPILLSDKAEYIPAKRSSSLIDKLIDLAHQIDDTGLKGLIDVAECFTKSHPARKAKAS